MLNFHLDLQSPLFMNLQKFDNTFVDCRLKRIPFMKAKEIVRSEFSHLTDDQFFEIHYEWQELLTARNCKPRHRFWDITEAGSNKVRDMLIARSESDFAKNPYFIQFMGRGMRMPKDVSNLIGKQVQIKINRKKDE